MSDKILLTTHAGIGGHQVAFVTHPDVRSLPDRPGIFVLLGTRGTGRDEPLYFGYADLSMRDQVPYDPGFAQALRQGLLRCASAYLPGGIDPNTLVRELAETYDAPVNAAAAALAEIEAAQTELQAMATARRIAAQ